MDPDSLRRLAMLAVGLVIAVTVHEFAHARAALAAGDDTAKRMGRVSLNPIDHLDLFGTLLFISLIAMNSSFVFGWGKPVPVNPANFKSPRWDSLKVSLWGPLSNVITACVLTLVLKYLILPYASMAYIELAGLCIKFNLVLAVFNLLPILPLDGSKIFSSLLPITQARIYERAVSKYGMFIVFALILIRIPGHGSIISMAIIPPVDMAFRALMGFVIGHGPMLT